MRKFLKYASAALCVTALCGAGLLLALDGSGLLHDDIIRNRFYAAPLMLIGASYVMLQASSAKGVKGRFKNTLLGLAFVLWGAVQLMPPSRLALILDSAVVALFVIDLSYIISDQLRNVSTNDTP